LLKLKSLDRARLTADARQHLPDADSVCVKEVMNRLALFKLVAWKNGTAPIGSKGLPIRPARATGV